MADMAASVLAKLKNKAKSSGISYQQCLQLFFQEEFLRRFGVGSLTDLPEPSVEQVEEFRMEAEEEIQYTSEEKEDKALKETAAAEE